MFYGYFDLIARGAIVTLNLALCSVLLAVVTGLAGAVGKSAKNTAIVKLFNIYTTLVRGVPDLLLMLLIYYGLQITLNKITTIIGMELIEIDPMTAGVLTLSFIYGAYFTETFRGAYLAVSHGELEAADAYGFTATKRFRRIMFPAMMRYALPGIGNNWQVVLKATALVSLLGLEDLVRSTQLAGKSTWQPFYFSLICGGIYLLFSTFSGVILWWLQRRYTVGVKRSAL